MGKMLGASVLSCPLARSILGAAVSLMAYDHLGDPAGFGGNMPTQTAGTFP